MSKSQGHWLNWFARAYYVTGLFYYLYKWIFLLGVLGLIGTLFSRTPVVASVIATLSVAAILIGISFWRRSVRIQFSSLNPALRIHAITLDYTCISDTEYEYVRTVEARAIYPIDHYSAKFKWSSEGVVSAAPLSGVKKVEIIDPPADLFNMCRVMFDRPLSKSSSHTFSYKLTLTKAQSPVKKYLGHRVEAPGNRIQIKIKFNNPVGEYRRQIFMNPASEIPMWEEVVVVNDGWRKEISWDIPKAMYGYYYRMSW